MKTLFFMHVVTTYPEFEKVINRIAKQKDAMLFNCYVQGDIFTISTARRVQNFDFTNFKDEKTIVEYISRALQILRTHIPLSSPKPLLLDDYTETIAMLR